MDFATEVKVMRAIQLICVCIYIIYIYTVYLLLFLLLLLNSSLFYLGASMGTPAGISRMVQGTF